MYIGEGGTSIRGILARTMHTIQLIPAVKPCSGCILGKTMFEGVDDHASERVSHIFFPPVGTTCGTQLVCMSVDM